MFFYLLLHQNCIKEEILHVSSNYNFIQGSKSVKNIITNLPVTMATKLTMLESDTYLGQILLILKMENLLI